MVWSVTSGQVPHPIRRKPKETLDAVLYVLSVGGRDWRFSKRPWTASGHRSESRTWRIRSNHRHRVPAGQGLEFNRLTHVRGFAFARCSPLFPKGHDKSVALGCFLCSI